MAENSKISLPSWYRMLDLGLMALMFGVGVVGGAVWSERVTIWVYVGAGALAIGLMQGFRWLCGRDHKREMADLDRLCDDAKRRLDEARLALDRALAEAREEGFAVVEERQTLQ